MEKELNEGLLELPKLHIKKNNKEFLAINVEDGIEEEKSASDDDSWGEDGDIFKEKETKMYLRNRQTGKEDIDWGTTSANADLGNSIKKSISLYTSRNSSLVCIYKVPAKLKKVNNEAYTPLSVSIGPIHHGRPELQEMQRYKWRFLDRYLRESSESFNFLVQAARDMENQVRQCYQEPFDHISSKEFSEMIMLDGIFLTVLLQEKERVKRESPKLALPPSAIVQVSVETIITTGSGQEPSTASKHISKNYWVRSEIIHDLMLLENQLPLFVLQTFHNYMGRFQLKLEESIHEFFSEVGNIGTLERENPITNARHLVDFLRTCHKPKHRSSTKGKIVYNHSASELQEAGVKFIGASHYNLFEIEFLRGEVAIPRLRIDEHTETLFRNVIAYEQCQYDKRKYITSYGIFMDSLINTTKDVDLLVDCGILENNLGDHGCVASLFNNLHKERVRPDTEFYFEKLCTDLNDYSKDYWHQWKAKWFRSKKVLRRDYFNSPWSTISVIAAVILLVLTTVQTICSIISI